MAVVATGAHLQTPGQRVWPRIMAVLALTAGASTLLAVDTVRQAGTGSYTAFLVVVPVLAALIASGIRPSPGVGDVEFDWILAVVFGAAGLLAIELVSQRLPALANLWNWGHYALVVWAMSAGMVLFSARHVLRLWRAWVFTLCCVPAMPFLLLTAQLGGTEEDAVLLGVGLGTLAVYLATSTFARLWRLVAAAINLVAALILDVALVGIDNLLGWHDVLARTVVVAGVIPALSVAAVRRAAHVRVAASLAAHPARGSARFPRVGVRSYAVLILLGAGIMFTSTPVSAVQPGSVADSGWVNRLNLQRTGEFDFIRRFAGPGATLTRYTSPTPDGAPAVAVDVIEAPDLARLNDFDDAVWYPSSAPVNYRTADLDGPGGVDAKAAQSDPDTADAAISAQWHALTWLWRTDVGYQRVTVVVNQDLTAGSPPPPGAIGWTNSLLAPMLWLTRQQPAPSGIVPKRVTRTAEALARQILAAAKPR